jgi:hypothetical protein
LGHICVFRKKKYNTRGNTKSPILNFHDDLVGLLTEWKNPRDELVIMGDFN